MRVLDIVTLLGKALAVVGYALALVLLYRVRHTSLWGLQWLLGCLLGLTMGLMVLDIGYEALRLSFVQYSDTRRLITGVLLAGSAWSFVLYLLWGE